MGVRRLMVTIIVFLVGGRWGEGGWLMVVRESSSEDIQDMIDELSGEIIAHGGRVSGNLKIAELKKWLKEKEEAG